MNSEKYRRILYIALSLLLAVIFWLYVDSAEGNTTTKDFTNLPVEFIGAEDTLPSRGLMVTGGEDATVDIRLSGPRSVISALRRSDLTLQVSLTDITAAGTYSKTFTLLTADTVDRSSITMESSSLSAITVQVEPLSTRLIPVTVELSGEVAENYICMRSMQTVEPASITLSGRDEDIDQVSGAVIRISMAGADKSISQEYTYDLVDAAGRTVENDAIRVSDRRVLVSVPVYMTKELALKVNYIESPGSTLEHVDASLDVETVTVAGEPASLEGKDDIVLADVDLSAYPEDAEIPLEISMPAECVPVSGETTATLSLHFRDLDTRVLTVTNISATGLSEGQSFRPITNSVEVRLRGSAEDLALITPEDVRVVVDVSQYTTNTTSSEPAMVFVDGYDGVGAVGVYNVFFKITF